MLTLNAGFVLILGAGQQLGAHRGQFVCATESLGSGRVAAAVEERE